MKNFLKSLINIIKAIFTTIYLYRGDIVLALIAANQFAEILNKF